MPGKKGKKQIAGNIREFRKGKTFKKTKAKHGKAVADKQAVAVGMRQAGMPMPAHRGESARGEGSMERYARKRRSSGY
jgi:hypothetical protein